MTARLTFAQHLERSVMPEPNSGCWLWTGWMNWAGYGRWKNDAGKEVLAHRASWEHHNGPIPNGLDVLHKCDVRCCVNPAHFFLGTQADNNADCRSKGRHVAPAGALHGRAKLSEREVLAVLGDPRPATVLAAKMGMHPTSLTAIRRGKNWRTLVAYVRHQPASDAANNIPQHLGLSAPLEIGVRHERQPRSDHDREAGEAFRVSGESVRECG